MKMKKLLALLLTLVMVVGLLPTFALPALATDSSERKLEFDNVTVNYTATSDGSKTEIGSYTNSTITGKVYLVELPYGAVLTGGSKTGAMASMIYGQTIYNFGSSGWPEDLSAHYVDNMQEAPNTSYQSMILDKTTFSAGSRDLLKTTDVQGLALAFMSMTAGESSVVIVQISTVPEAGETPSERKLEFDNVTVNYTATKDGSKTEIGSYTNSTITGKVYLVELPYGAVLTGGSKTGAMASMIYGQTIYNFGSSGWPEDLSAHYVTNMQEAPNTSYQSMILDKTTFSAGSRDLLKTTGVQGLALAFMSMTAGESSVVIVQISTVPSSGGGQTVNKNELASIIADINEADYYTTGDYWNGKDTNPNGFWNDLKPVLNDAKSVMDNTNAKQVQVNAVAKALAEAKASLIPRARVNATVLHELSTTEWGWFGVQLKDRSLYPSAEAISASNTSPTSLKAYTDALAAAQAELAKLYYQAGDEIPAGSEVGDPKPYNDSTGAAATNVNDAYTALNAAVEGLDKLTEADDAIIAWDSLSRLANKVFHPALLTEEDYTPASWRAFLSARETALTFLSTHSAPGATIGTKEGKAYVDAYCALWNACYEGLVPAKTGTATVSVSDVYGLTTKTVNVDGLYGGHYSVEINTTGGMKLDALLKSTLVDNYSDAMSAVSVDYALGIFLNGVYLFNMKRNSANNTYVGSLLYENVLVKPGDTILVARMRVPMSNNMSGGATVERAAELVGDIRYLTATGEKMTEGVVEVTAGTSVKLKAWYMLAMVNGYTGGTAALSGATVYLSDCYATKAEALAAIPSQDSGKTTGTDGSFALALSSAPNSGEGWYALSLIAPGEKGGVSAGANVIVHVTDPSDLSAIKQAALDKLAALRNRYDDEFYSDAQLADITAAYNTAVTAVGAAGNSGTIAAAYEAAAAVIEPIQTANQENLEIYLTDIENCLKWLPTMSDLNAGKLYQPDMAILEALFGDEGIYSARMSAYQKDQIRQSVMNDLRAFETVYAKIKSGERTLNALPVYNVSIHALDADSGETVEGAITEVTLTRNSFLLTWQGERLKIGAGGMNINESYTAGACNLRETYPIESETLYRNRISIYFSDGTAENQSPYLVEHVDASPLDAHYLTSDGDEWCEVRVAGVYGQDNCVDGFFITPRRDLEINVYLKLKSASAPDPAAQALAAAKETALADLNSTYATYKRANYTAETWSTIYQAYQKGVADINAATSQAEIDDALSTALQGMNREPDKQQNSTTHVVSRSGFDAGLQVGTVTLTVENTTFPGGDFPGGGQTGTIFSETDYPLGAGDSMMTVILRALDDHEFTWNGTIGESGNSVAAQESDFNISYLATIHKGGETMGEFSGDPGSGWMGSLNDFMVNEGFPGFTVKDGTLGDGDEIKLMFTQNLGVDLGGTWGNSDTTLKSLELSSGTLIPGFASGEAGNTYDFALMISGSSDSIVVTPHATNINYMVKTFLNEKVTTDDITNSFYRRREAIPVRPGDVIWVGVGEKAWPSMNSYGAEARAYTGTWYALHVISADSGADYVNELIAKLPAEKNIKYSNYEDVQKQIAVIDEVCKALSTAEQKNVNSATLKTARDKAEDYQEIDNVKAMLAALPKDATDAQVLAAADKIRAAEAAYLALEPWQQDYITVGDAAKYNALVTKWKELTPEGEQGSIPQLIAGGSGGEKKDKKDEGNEIAAAEVTVAAEVVDGKATAEVSAEDVSKALEEAPDAKTLTVKVNTEGADKVEADLPAEAVKAAAGAGVGLNVETENGTVKVDAETLAEAAKAGKDVAVTVTENKDGTTTVGVTADGKAVEADVKIELEAKDGQMLVVVGADGSETPVILSATEDGTMYAKVPAGSTVKVVDAEGKDFGDVKAGDWFAEAVEFVSSHGIFQGTGEGFEPGTTMNRAMLAMVLYRIDGATGGGTSTFADVKPEDWFADAVAWAADAGIVNGRGEGFAPDAPVTREEIATMLYRFVQYLGVDVSGASADLAKFPDGGSTSPWAGDAMAWAVSVGLFKGDDTGSLNPGGEATRAEVATLVERLVKLLVK